jgi:hypothetical protein
MNRRLITGRKKIMLRGKSIKEAKRKIDPNDVEGCVLLADYFSLIVGL